MTDQQPTTEALLGPTLDHLALASYNAWDNVIRYCYHLGARWLGGPPDLDIAFYFAHVELADGAKLEFLEPRPDQGSDFLRRFLHRNGPGPHHFTFKVPDIDAAMAEVNAAGYQIVNEDLSDPDWKEAFLHPKQSHGIVIQLAQPGGEAGWDDPLPLPPSPQARLPKLTAIKHLVADLGAATKLFTGPLGMRLAEEGTNHEGDYAIVAQGPWNIRLIRPSAGPYVQWLGDRPGRILQLQMEIDDPSLVPALRPGGIGFWEIPPDLNQGTRILLQPRSS